MLRHCDGSDPNLQVYVHPDGTRCDFGSIYKCSSQHQSKPCDCGKTFDDVNHIVIYPHPEF